MIHLKTGVVGTGTSTISPVGLTRHGFTVVVNKKSENKLKGRIRQFKKSLFPTAAAATGGTTGLGKRHSSDSGR